MKHLVKKRIYLPSELGAGAGDGSDIDFNGNRPVTRNTPGIIGVTPGGNNLKAFLENLIYPPVAPVAALSVDRVARELGEDPAYTLTWSVIKKTNPIVSITVDGQTIAPSGVDQNGTQSGVFPDASGEYTLNMAVVDGGGLSDNESVKVTYFPRMYFGTTPKNGGSEPITDADILSISGSELRANRNKVLSNFGGGAKRLIFVFDTSFGTPQFKVNGLANTAFTKVRTNSDFVNQHGRTVKVDVWVSDNIYNSPLDTVEIA